MSEKSKKISSTQVVNSFSTTEVKSLSDVEADERKAKRYRRKRGNGRPRSYKLSPEEASNGEEDKRKKRRSLDRVNMAPLNTTQFLLEDREARAEAEHDSEQQYEEAERKRIRSISGSSDHNTCLWQSNSDHGSKDGDSDVDRELDREFETEYLEVKRERIEKMSKTELEQELLERDRDTETLHDQCEKINSENRHLKELLAANGISFDAGNPVSSTSVMNQHESRSPRVTAT